MHPRSHRHRTCSRRRSVNCVFRKPPQRCEKKAKLSTAVKVVLTVVVDDDDGLTDVILPTWGKHKPPSQSRRNLRTESAI